MTSQDLLSIIKEKLSNATDDDAFFLCLPISFAFSEWKASEEEERFGMCWTATDNKCISEDSTLESGNSLEAFFARLEVDKSKVALQQADVESIQYIIAAEALGETVLAEKLSNAEKSHAMLEIRDLRASMKELLSRE